MNLKKYYESFWIITKCLVFDKFSVHLLMDYTIDIFILFFFIIDICFLFVLYSLLALIGRLSTLIYTFSTNLESIIIIGLCFLFFIYIFSRLFLGKIPVKKIIKIVFLVVYVFPVILVSRFITLNLFWYITLLAYLSILLYKTISTEINCKKANLLLTVFISIIATIYVVLLISTKIYWFL
jgi:hypothetical protein